MSYESPGLPEDREYPYAAPLAEVGRHSFELELGPALPPVPPTAGAIFSRSYETYKQRMGICIAVIFGGIGLVLLSLFAMSLLETGLNGADLRRVAGVLTLMLTLWLLSFQVQINVGQALVMLKVARGRPARFEDVLSGGQFLLRILFALLLVAAALAPVAIAAVAPALIFQGDPQTQGIAVAVGVLVAILVDSVIVARFFPFFYLIIDRDAGALESLGLAMRLTKARVGLIFSVGLLAFLINMGGLLACGIGLMFTMPLTSLMMAMTYVALVGAAAPAVASPGVATPEMKLPGDPDFGVLP